MDFLFSSLIFCQFSGSSKTIFPKLIDLLFVLIESLEEVVDIVISLGLLLEGSEDLIER